MSSKNMSSEKISNEKMNNKMNSSEIISSEMKCSDLISSEITSSNVATSERKISENETKIFKIRDVEGDGNCLFRYFSTWECFGDKSYCKDCREYVREMGEDRTFGTDLEIEIFSELYNVVVDLCVLHDQSRMFPNGAEITRDEVMDGFLFKCFDEDVIEEIKLKLLFIGSFAGGHFQILEEKLASRETSKEAIQKLNDGRLNNNAMSTRENEPYETKFQKNKEEDMEIVKSIKEIKKRKNMSSIAMTVREHPRSSACRRQMAPLPPSVIYRPLFTNSRQCRQLSESQAITWFPLVPTDGATAKLAGNLNYT